MLSGRSQRHLVARDGTMTGLNSFSPTEKPNTRKAIVTAATRSRTSNTSEGQKSATTLLCKSAAPRVKPTIKLKLACSVSSPTPHGIRPLLNNGYRSSKHAIPASSNIRLAQAQMLYAQHSAESETSELRTLLKLPGETPSAEVIHKLRETFHLMNRVEKFRTDLGRMLRMKDAQTVEGALRNVQDLLSENKQLGQKVERQQEIIVKLQEDRQDILKRFHRLTKEHAGKHHSESMAPNGDVHFLLADQGLSSDTPGVLPTRATHLTSSFREWAASSTGEQRNLATMLTSHMAKASQNVMASKQRKDVSPVYIRHQKNKDHKKMMYKITGILRPGSASTTISASSGDAVLRPSVMAAFTSSVSTISDLPEIAAHRQMPTAEKHRLKTRIEKKAATQAPSRQHSLTDSASTSTTATMTGTSEINAVSKVNAANMPPFKTKKLGHSDNKLGLMSKQFSGTTSSTASSEKQAAEPQVPRPGSGHGQDEPTDDLFSDIKKDDLISLIFAPLLKDRYLSRFTVLPPGGTLSIPEVGLTLSIPENALPVGTGSVDILLGMSYNPVDTPSVGVRHRITCPTVLCATHPARIRFRSLLVLAFAHSSGRPETSRTKMTSRILHSMTDVGHPTRWEEFEAQADEVTEQEFGCVAEDHCTVFLSQLRLFSLVREQGTGLCVSRVATKFIRIVVFVSYSPVRDTVALNIYCTDSLPSERQLLRRECRLESAGVQAGDQPMVMSGTGGDLIVSVRHLPQGWRLNGLPHESLSYEKAWHNLHPHVTFLLECAPDTWDSEVTCSVHVQQLNTEDKEATADIYVSYDLAQVDSCADDLLPEQPAADIGLPHSFLRGQTPIDIFAPHTTPDPTTSLRTLLREDPDVEPGGPGGKTPGPGQPLLLLLQAAWIRPVTPPLVPAALGRRLAALLGDPGTGRLGPDWRHLAAELDIETAVPHLAAGPHPAAHVLTACGTLCAGLHALRAVLERIGREDAAREVQTHLSRAGAGGESGRAGGKSGGVGGESGGAGGAGGAGGREGGGTDGTGGESREWNWLRIQKP